MEVVIRTPVSLYRYLLRSVSLLPKDAQHYYKHRIRQVSTHSAYIGPFQGKGTPPHSGGYN